MGYRHYFYSVDKAEFDASLAELSKEKSLSCMSIYDVLPDMEQIFEFGKLYYDDTAERIAATGVPAFENLQWAFEYEDPFLVDQEAIKVAINVWRKRIQDDYKCILDGHTASDRDIPKHVLMKCFIKCIELASDWQDGGKVYNKNFPLDLNESSDNICCSWMYEYEIFDLVHILKTFDFENKYLLFFGC